MRVLSEQTSEVSLMKLGFESSILVNEVGPSFYLLTVSSYLRCDGYGLF